MSLKLWALTDNRAGNNSQSLGLAEALGAEFLPIPLTYTRFTCLPASVAPSFLPYAELPDAALPDAIIAAGRKASMAARFFKHRSGGKSRIIQLMNPGGGYQDIDVLVLPEHDRPPTLPASTTLLKSRGALHRVTAENIQKAAKLWRTHHPRKRRTIALILGGSTRHGTFTEANAERLAIEASTLALDREAELLITTSRRTDATALMALERTLNAPYQLRRWRADMPPEQNPYPALLGLADEVIVTGESTSMLSEACLSGKPVWIADIGRAIAKKHHRLHLSLIEHDHAMMLELPPPPPFPAQKLDETTRIAHAIQALPWWKTPHSKKTKKKD